MIKVESAHCKKQYKNSLSDLYFPSPEGESSDDAAEVFQPREVESPVVPKRTSSSTVRKIPTGFHGEFYNIRW